MNAAERMSQIIWYKQRRILRAGGAGRALRLGRVLFLQINHTVYLRVRTIIAGKPSGSLTNPTPDMAVAGLCRKGVLCKVFAACARTADRIGAESGNGEVSAFGTDNGRSNRVWFCKNLALITLI